MTKKQALEMLAKYKVLTVKSDEKHGDYQYLATTEDELRNACCAIIANRKDYYYPPDEPAKPELTAEQVAQLPDGEIKIQALKQHEQHKRQMRDYQEELEVWEAVQKVAKTGDLEAAIMVLEIRSNYEYEGFSIEAGQKAKPFKPFKLTHQQE